MTDNFKQGHPPLETQDWPGSELKLSHVENTRLPEYEYKGAGKLAGKKALITGGDSGIGRASAILMAREGAKICFSHLPEEIEDALDTKRRVEEEGQECFLFQADLSQREACIALVEYAGKVFEGSFDVIFNNAGIQQVVEKIEDVEDIDWDFTFRVNVYAMFYICKYALKLGFLKTPGSIINNASVNAYAPRPDLLDYSASKGAIVAFTRSLSTQIVARGIRVNNIAPGPVWTPLVASTFDKGRLRKFGVDAVTTPMKRPAQTSEIAACVVFLASGDSSQLSGQTLHRTQLPRQSLTIEARHAIVRIIQLSRKFVVRPQSTPPR